MRFKHLEWEDSVTAGQNQKQALANPAACQGAAYAKQLMSSPPTDIILLPAQGIDSRGCPHTAAPASSNVQLRPRFQGYCNEAAQQQQNIQSAVLCATAF